MATVLPMLAIVLCALVVLSDLYARRVPNTWLVITLSVAACAGLLSLSMGAEHPARPSLLGLMVGLVSMLPFYAIRWMGAGDVKFFATLGFLLGTHALLPIWAIGCLLTGVHAFAVIVLRLPQVAGAPGITTARQHLYASPLWQRILCARQGRVGQPHAAYLGIATILVVLHPELLPWGHP